MIWRACELCCYCTALLHWFDSLTLCPLTSTLFVAFYIFSCASRLLDYPGQQKEHAKALLREVRSRRGHQMVTRSQQKQGSSDPEGPAVVL
jgi:hypothetical protein